ncbi:hypothetical protein ACHAWF_005550 [Thalassiosira exigua]
MKLGKMVKNNDNDLLSRIIFRNVQPTDIPRCHQIESASYPVDEAASKSTLQYRQHHGAAFFRCAFLVGDSAAGGGTTSTSSSISYQGRSMNPRATLRGTIIGYICATRCKSFTAEAMKTHDSLGKILAIHSVAVEDCYRDCGVATAMLKDYLSSMERLNNKGNLKVKMEKNVLLAKKNMLAFYVRNGFIAMGLSKISHGKEQWFELERNFDMSQGNADVSHKCYIVDSFADTDKQGSGNPAAVVLLDGPPGEDESTTILTSQSGSQTGCSLDEIDENGNSIKQFEYHGASWMATVAKEFNQSETAFVWPRFQEESADDDSSSLRQANGQHSTYDIRYYTRSGAEVDLCGHATLAAALVLLLPQKMDDPKQIHKADFFSKSEFLQTELLVPPSNSQPSTPVPNSNKSSRIAMNFPWKKVVSFDGHCRGEVLNMISCAFSAVAAKGEASNFCPSGKDKIPSFFNKHVVDMGLTDGSEDLFLELTVEGFESLQGIDVNFGALLAWEGYSRGVIICCSCAPESDSTTRKSPLIDFRSRFFGPKVGIDEDHVTGSAHCSLGPYFGEKLGKTVVVGRQESERGGLVECILKPEEGRVCIVGTAVVTVAGQLLFSV